MAKAKSFADKVAGAGVDHAQHCPKCGEAISMIKLVAAETKERTGAIRFRQKFVGMCKCNENDLTGTEQKTEQPVREEMATEQKAAQPVGEKTAAEQKTEQPVNEETAAGSGNE